MSNERKETTTDEEKIEAIREIYRRPAMQIPEYWTEEYLDGIVNEISNIIDPPGG